MNPVPLTLKKFALSIPVTGDAATRNFEVRHWTKRTRSGHGNIVRAHARKVTPERARVDWFVSRAFFWGRRVSHPTSFL